MNVLGISYGYHDASATLVVDGRIVAAAAEERFTRQKHDANFPTYAIRHCLSTGGLSTEDLDQVVFHEDPHTKFTRVLTSSLAPFPHSRREFVNSAKSWLGNKLWALNTISSRLDVPPEKISYVGHHFSHGLQAFMGSGFEEAGILVVDAVGDWSSTALYKGSWTDGAPQVERILEIAFPHSLGLVYSAITAYLGFRPNDSEATTMALAAFGEPIFADALRQIVRGNEDGAYEVDQSYFNFSNFYRGAFTPKLVELLGPPRSSSDPLAFDCFQPNALLSAEQQRFANVAASIQLVLEERILALADLLYDTVPSKNLCCAGGVAFNCVANYRLLTDSPFDNLYIPPDPGDGGTSVGTSLYVAAQEGNLSPQDLRHGPYLGQKHDAGTILSLLEHVSPDHMLPYVKRGVPVNPGTEWKVQTFDDEADLCNEVANRLMNHDIVGWVQGGFEMGPRALGNRSILARPDDLDTAMRLSRMVKERAAYRPYAFSVTTEDALKILDIAPEHVSFNRWMQLAVPVVEDKKDRVQATLHVDGTTRPQVCGDADNPRYHALLQAFGERFGLGVVLNTSFNPSGYPLVASPVEALVMFARTDMDALVVDNSLIWKDRANREEPT